MLLFVIFTLLVAGVLGRALGYGLSFAGVMIAFSGVSSFVSYYYSDKIVLSLSGAKPADPKKHSSFVRSIENMAIASGLPKPKMYVIDDPAPNAFATGRDPKHAAVAVTSGLLATLSNAELEGVIAHEMSHIKNFDTRLMGIVAILVGSLVILSDVFFRQMFFSSMFGKRDSDRGGGAHPIFAIAAIVFAVLAPILATIMKFAISRKREFLADADAALMTRYPDGLARALEKIAAHKQPMKNANNATAHLYIENPFKTDVAKHASWFAKLFSTHPPVEERIRILRSM